MGIDGPIRSDKKLFGEGHLLPLTAKPLLTIQFYRIA
jgi:hypothetical protein